MGGGLDAQHNLVLQTAGAKYTTQILCTVHSAKDALLVAHRLDLLGVANRAMIRCFEGEESMSVQQC